MRQSLCESRGADRSLTVAVQSDFSHHARMNPKLSAWGLKKGLTGRSGALISSLITGPGRVESGIAHQREDRGHQAQAVVRSLHVQAARDAGVLSSGEHQDRMCRDLQKRSGIEAAHIEPAGRSGAVAACGRDSRRAEGLRSKDDAVRITRPVHRLEPFGFAVPVVEPGFTFGHIE
jgi:hypothetical protein